MKTNKKSSRRVIILLVSIIGLIVVASVAAYALYPRQNTISNLPTPTVTEPIDTQPPTQEQIQNSTAIKEASTQAQATPTSPQAPSYTISITTPITGQSQDKSSVIHVRTLIDSVVSPGSCSISLTSGATVKNLPSVGVQAQSSSSTCQGFDIPANTLTAGLWTAHITVTSGSVTNSVSRDINVI